MTRRVVAALVVALLAVSCTPGQPDVIGSGKAGEDPVERRLRAQGPADNIATGLDAGYCPVTARGCLNVVHPIDQRRTKFLVEQLQQDRPSWLRYVKAVETGSLWNVRSGRGGAVQVQTGIFVNEAGKDVGAAICLALLEKKFDNGLVWGVSRSLPAPTPRASWVTPLLAKCH